MTTQMSVMVYQGLFSGSARSANFSVIAGACVSVMEQQEAAITRIAVYGQNVLTELRGGPLTNQDFARLCREPLNFRLPAIARNNK